MFLPASLLISSYMFSSSSSLCVIAGIFTCKATVRYSSCVTFCLTPKLGYLKGVCADFFLYEVQTFLYKCPFLYLLSPIMRIRIVCLIFPMYQYLFPQSFYSLIFLIKFLFLPQNYVFTFTYASKKYMGFWKVIFLFLVALVPT